MGNFKIGDEVVCIGINDININDGLKYAHPKIGEKVTIDHIGRYGWLGLCEYHTHTKLFEPWNFRKLERHTAKHVNVHIKEIEERIEEPELV